MEMMVWYLFTVKSNFTSKQMILSILYKARFV